MEVRSESNVATDMWTVPPGRRMGHAGAIISAGKGQRLRSTGLPEGHCSTDPRLLFQKIDAAVIATPAPTHFEMCRELLEMGKDVFVEKPITLVSNEAKKLTELAEKSGLVLQVGHIFRFDPASLWLKEAIAAGRFGRLKMLRARFSGFKRPRHDTGVTFADSIHFIDLFNFFLGVLPWRVHAATQDFFERGVDDESLLVMQYGRGSNDPMFATIEAGYHAPGKFRELTVVGTDSSALCDYNVAQYKIKRSKIGTSRRTARSERSKARCINWNSRWKNHFAPSWRRLLIRSKSGRRLRLMDGRGSMLFGWWKRRLPLLEQEHGSTFQMNRDRYERSLTGCGCRGKLTASLPNSLDLASSDF